MRKEQRRGRKIFLPVERYMTGRDGIGTLLGSKITKKDPGGAGSIRLVQIDVHVPAYASGLGLVVMAVPVAGMMMVVVVVASFVAARQRERNGAQEENETQHVFDRVLHKNGF
jgi:hypothetical protein